VDHDIVKLLHLRKSYEEQLDQLKKKKSKESETTSIHRLKDTFVSQFYPKRELETAQIIAQYCEGNLASIANIREEMGSLASGGTKKMIEEIDALERMLQEIMEATNQAGAGINRNPLPIPFTDMYTPMHLNCQQRERKKQ